MISSDYAEFTKQLQALCLGFNVPLGDRPDAYWKGLQKMALSEFTRCVEFALGEHGPEKIPTTGEVWRIRGRLRTASQAGIQSLPSPIDTTHASVQEQLCEYAMRRLGVSALKKHSPWSYVYREWKADGKRQAECVAIVIDVDENSTLRFNVSDMLADDRYPQILAYFAPARISRGLLPKVRDQLEQRGLL